MKFSSAEKRDLLLAGLLLSLAFAILLSGGFNAFLSLDISFMIIFVIAFLTAGLAFLLHELMHKYVAQRYGLFAEFKAFYNMIFLALAFSLFGFIIAAPGAVFIKGKNITKEKNGKISVAGPLTNIVLAIIFLIFSLFIKEGFLGSLFSYGLSINSLLAAFNMIPTMPFDGAKIIAWNKGVYYVTLIIAIGLFFTSFLF